MTLEEFSERVGVAYAARTRGELAVPPDLEVPTLHLRLDTRFGTVKVYRT